MDFPQLPLPAVECFVQLDEIHIVARQAAQRRIEGLAWLVVGPDLRGDRHLLAVGPEGPAEQGFRGAVAVGGGRIEEVDAALGSPRPGGGGGASPGRRPPPAAPSGVAGRLQLARLDDLGTMTAGHEFLRLDDLHLILLRESVKRRLFVQSYGFPSAPSTTNS